jgi:hypothetical protein
MKKILALLAALCCGSALAASTTTDLTDLWFNTNEEGWGANVIHQRDTLFITLFVYGENNAPTWYVASDVSLSSAANGVLTYTGALFRTTGPYFGASTFNEADVNVVPVGTLTFVATELNAATLTYVVSGVTVTKSLTRQTWKAETMAGQFAGGSMVDWSNCTFASGHTEAFAGFTVTHSATNVVSILEAGASGYTCNYNGNYTQTGRLGRFTGSGTCSDGFNPGTVTLSEIYVNASSLSFRIEAVAGNCRMTGKMGGVRR